MNSFTYKDQTYYYLITSDMDDVEVISVVNEDGDTILDPHIIELALQDYENNGDECA